MKHLKFYKKVLIFLIVVTVIYFLFQNKINNFFINDLGLSKPEEMFFDVVDDLFTKAENTIFAPPPLKSDDNAENANLIKSEVIRWTNVQRQNNGLNLLTENLKLDLSADNKIKDMFINQYFEHQSPVGVNVGDLIKRVGYDYLIVGENLAMGNFENSEKLVKAWMESPGHRENILNSKYQEIGVAVLQGVYEGEKVWMAVQHFGLPASYCPKPDQNLKIEIDTDERLVNEIKESLDLLRTELERYKPKTKEEVEDYNQKVDKYNLDLNQYNLFVEQVKELINDYNYQVELFNNCLNNIK